MSSCLNESEAEVVPVDRVRRVLYGILDFFFSHESFLEFVSTPIRLYSSSSPIHTSYPEIASILDFRFSEILRLCSRSKVSRMLQVHSTG